jgi:quinoprotein glucose dehydrogenase
MRRRLGNDSAIVGVSAPPRYLAAILFLFGLLLATGGFLLVELGGSVYYIVAGVAVIASAVLLWCGRRSGAWLYGSFLFGTLIWSLWEVGFDVWALTPRLLLPTILGSWLLIPSVRHRLA